MQSSCLTKYFHSLAIVLIALTVNSYGIDKPASGKLQKCTALTFSGKVEGNVAIDGEKLQVNGREVSLASLLVLTRDVAATNPTQNQAIRLINGEMWYVSLDGLKKKTTVLISSPALGKQEIPLKQIASIEFDTSVILTDGEKPGMLHRRNGDPIEGTLVWIKETDVALKCGLGIVPIPMPLITRFVVAPMSGSGVSLPTEITLADRSVVRGSLKIAQGGLVLSHRILGDLKLKLDDFISIRNTPAGMAWLGGPNLQSVKRIGPVDMPPVPSVIKSGFSRVIRMMPSTVATYAVPEDIAKNKFKFRAYLAPISANRSDVNVSITVAGKVVWKKNVNVTMEPVAISVDLPACSNFSIEVAFGKRIIIPCGVEWRDACLLSATADGK